MESKEHLQQQIQQQSLQRGFEPFPKLPSFQSQFHSFSDTSLVSPEPSLPTQITAVPVPISPSSASPNTSGSLTQLTQLTQLTSSPLTSMQTGNFHTLTAVNPRHCYPVVPAPIQARDIPSIQQQYLDERHIQLYQPITTTTFHHPAPPQQMVTVIKNESVSYDLKNNFQSPMINNDFISNDINSTKPVKNGTPAALPTNNNGKGETRKKERRKIRASSLESSTESDASSAMDIDGNSSGNPGQVPSVSSTANFKSPMQMSMTDDNENGNGDKQVRF